MIKKICLITMTIMTIVSFSACSDKKDVDYSAAETVQNGESLEQDVQTLPKESLSASEPETSDEINTESSEKIAPENGKESEKSAAIQNLRQKMEDFSYAYFGGDLEAVKGFLSESFRWDIDVYEGSEAVEDIQWLEIKGLTDVSELDASEQYFLAKPFILPGEDSITYLSVVFVNEGGEWKVSEYGLEK